jgi:hypothetical protein
VFIEVLTVFSVFIPLLVIMPSIANSKKVSRSSLGTALLILSFNSFGFDSLSYLFHVYSWYNSILNEFYTLFAIFLVLLILKILNGRKRQLFNILRICIVLLALVTYIISKDQGVLSIIYITFSLFVFFECILLYNDFLNDQVSEPIIQKPEFWVVSSLFVFYGFSIFVSLFEKYIIEGNMELYLAIWPIQLISNIVQFTLLSIAQCRIIKK